jgi:hypothetical protein
MKQQLTAVEWLVHELGLNCTTDYEDEIQEALEMEEEQIMDAHFEGSEDYRRQYYNKTFKQEK